MGAERNDPCACGSGKKYKRCCAGKRTPSGRRVWSIGPVLIAVLAGGLVWAVVDTVYQRRTSTATRVWSPEHKHWHGEQASVPGPQPPGQASPGKVWSEEHGHWHDAP